MDFKKELIKFIDENKIVGYSAGLIVALVTKDLILSIVADIVLPLILIILLKFNFKTITTFLDAKHKGILNITKFISSLATWILGIIITYLFVQYAFVRFLGAKYEPRGGPTNNTPKPTKNFNTDDAKDMAMIEGFSLSSLF